MAGNQEGTSGADHSRTTESIGPDSDGHHCEAGNFEGALAALEQLVERLESGELGLQEALGCYEQGVHLLANCQSVLDQVHRRIELLSAVDDQGRPILEPFEVAPTAGEGPGQPAACPSPSPKHQSTQAPPKVDRPKEEIPPTLGGSIPDSSHQESNPDSLLATGESQAVSAVEQSRQTRRQPSGMKGPAVAEGIGEDTALTANKDESEPPQLPKPPGSEVSQSGKEQSAPSGRPQAKRPTTEEPPY